MCVSVCECVSTHVCCCIVSHPVQSCLQQWLSRESRSGSSNNTCELCHTKFTFAPVYSDLAPKVSVVAILSWYKHLIHAKKLPLRAVLKEIVQGLMPLLALISKCALWVLLFPVTMPFLVYRSCKCRLRLNYLFL